MWSSGRLDVNTCAFRASLENSSWTEVLSRPAFGALSGRRRAHLSQEPDVIARLVLDAVANLPLSDRSGACDALVRCRACGALVRRSRLTGTGLAVRGEKSAARRSCRLPEAVEPETNVLPIEMESSGVETAIIFRYIDRENCGMCGMCRFVGFAP